MSVVYQGPGSEAGWKCDGDRQPGEKVLQDIRERRGQERRLQEIQQQLEILGQGQEMTVSSKQLRSFTHTHTHTRARSVCAEHECSSVDTCVTNYYKHTAHFQSSPQGGTMTSHAIFTSLQAHIFPRFLSWYHSLHTLHFCVKCMFSYVGFPQLYRNVFLSPSSYTIKGRGWLFFPPIAPPYFTAF